MKTGLWVWAPKSHLNTLLIDTPWPVNLHPRNSESRSQLCELDGNMLKDRKVSCQCWVELITLGLLVQEHNYSATLPHTHTCTHIMHTHTGMDNSVLVSISIFIFISFWRNFSSRHCNISMNDVHVHSSSVDSFTLC